MRKLWRLAWIGLLMLFALVALRILLGRLAGPSILAAARDQLEAEVGPLTSEVVDPPVPDEDNAAPLLLAASQALDLTHDDRGLTQALLKLGQELHDQSQRDRLHRVVERNGTALADLDLAAIRPLALFRPRIENFSRPTDQEIELGLVRFAPLLHAAGRVALDEHDDPAFVTQVARLTTIARALRQQRTLGDAILALSFERSLMDIVRLRAARPISPAEARRVDLSLTELASSPTIRQILATEAVLSDAAWAKRRRSQTSKSGFRLLDLVSPWSEEHFRADALRLYAALAECSDQPRDQWVEREPNVHWPSLRTWIDPWSTPDFLSLVLTPNLRDVVVQDQLARAERALAGFAFARLAGHDTVEPGPVAYSGERLVVRELGGGILELSLPKAASRLAAEAEDKDLSDSYRLRLRRTAERMTWRVAPLGASVESPPPAR
jgi:hypothetical protein